MKTYSINIAKATTMSDWQGLPSHQHMARLNLCDRLSEADALAEIQRLQCVYPWPEFHLSLSVSEVVTHRTSLASTEPAEFLAKHQWAMPSIHKRDA